MVWHPASFAASGAVCGDGQIFAKATAYDAIDFQFTTQNDELMACVDEISGKSTANVSG